LITNLAWVLSSWKQATHTFKHRFDGEGFVFSVGMSEVGKRY